MLQRRRSVPILLSSILSFGTLAAPASTVEEAGVPGIANEIPSGRLNGEFLCGFDWDGDGNTTDDAEDIVLCLDAARATLTSNEDSHDNAVRINLPAGDFDFCNAVALLGSGSGPAGGCPYTLEGGMHVEGVYPRTTENGIAPDLALEPNGGTWLDGSNTTNTMFDGNGLRGIVWSKVGFTNFGTVFEHGAPGVGGISMSRYEDLYFIGRSNQSGTAVKLDNFQHVRMDYLKFAFMDRCLHLIQDHAGWAGSNSVLTDIYCEVDSEPHGAILIENAAAQRSLNYLTLIRPQVNCFAGNVVPGTSLIWLKAQPDGGSITGIEIYGGDVEGKAEAGIKMTGRVTSSYISIANGTSLTPHHLWADADTTYNVLLSSSDQVTLRNESPTNTVYGIWRTAAASTHATGFFREALRSGQIIAEIDQLDNKAQWINVDADSSAHGAWFRPTLESDSGAGKAQLFGVRVNPILIDHDGAGRSDFHGLAVEPEVFGIKGQDTVDDFNGIKLSPRVGGDCGRDDCLRIKRYRALNIRPVLYGDNWRIDTAEIFNIQSPSVLPGNADVLNYAAFQIHDQRATGAGSSFTGRIRPQRAGPGGDVGNWWFEGRGHDEGHPVIGRFHVWDSDGAGLRIKASAPTHDGDGVAIVTGSGSSNQGPAIWSTGSDDCATVCANAGMPSCVDTAVIGSGMTGNCTDTSPARVCFCS